jgi:hypothetical protein
VSGHDHPSPSQIRVEDGLIALDDFRDFTFGNAVRLWGQVNPRFFEGTAVAKAAAGVLGTA